jgi:RNA recognition motif-containing protein
MAWARQFPLSHSSVHCSCFLKKFFRGFGFVTFRNPEAVTYALKKPGQDPHVIDGKRVDPKPAQDKNSAAAGVCWSPFFPNELTVVQLKSPSTCWVHRLECVIVLINAHHSPPPHPLFSRAPDILSRKRNENQFHMHTKDSYNMQPNLLMSQPHRDRLEV